MRTTALALLGLYLAGASVVSFAQSSEPKSCPQPRFTGKAPEPYYSQKNPLQGDQDLSETERLFRGEIPGKFGCAPCHGLSGGGNGKLSGQFDPPPRNFACAETIKDVPDGQLFWIIRFGSPGASMPPHKSFSDEQIWKLVLHIRHLAK